MLSAEARLIIITIKKIIKTKKAASKGGFSFDTI
jgi:hypothetical protein